MIENFLVVHIITLACLLCSVLGNSITSASFFHGTTSFPLETTRWHQSVRPHRLGCAGLVASTASERDVTRSVASVAPGRWGTLSPGLLVKLQPCCYRLVLPEGRC